MGKWVKGDVKMLIFYKYSMDRMPPRAGSGPQVADPCARGTSNKHEYELDPNLYLVVSSLGLQIQHYQSKQKKTCKKKRLFTINKCTDNPNWFMQVL